MEILKTFFFQVSGTVFEGVSHLTATRRLDHKLIHDDAVMWNSRTSVAGRHRIRTENIGGGNERGPSY